MSKQDNVSIREFRLSDLSTVRGLIQNTIDVCYSDVYPKEAVRFFKDWHCDEKILKDDIVGAVVEKAGRASSMKGNPIVLTDEELERIIVESL